jgi:hypothetical protein
MQLAFASSISIFVDIGIPLLLRPFVNPNDCFGVSVSLRGTQQIGPVNFF